MCLAWQEHMTLTEASSWLCFLPGVLATFCKRAEAYSASVLLIVVLLMGGRHIIVLNHALTAAHMKGVSWHC
jgi:hypothetical protein